MRQEVLNFEFVEFIPEEIEAGTIYISIRFATASHLCCCGCSNKVVTPISPTDWKLTFDGKSVSLEPSIGNWSFPCKSHYWIHNNRVNWARRWSKEEIERGRSHDRFDKKVYFAGLRVTDMDQLEDDALQPVVGKPRKTLWQAFKQWWH